MKNRLNSLLVLLIMLMMFNNTMANPYDKVEENEFVSLSMNLLRSVRDNGDVSYYQKQIRSLDLNKLANSLETDEEIKAFWINIYNAYVQLLLSDNPSLFDDRSAFFKDDLVNIGGEKLSFDFIEHGIIRGSKVKLSMGFLKDPFAGKLEKQFRVEDSDGRIHFALNCGATSCPEIAIYSSLELNKELDIIAEKFLKRTTTLKNETAYVTTLFNWFRGDFSDKGGVVGYLQYYGLIEKNEDPDIEYKEYDWTLALGNYTEL